LALATGSLDLERWQTPARPGLLRRPLDHFARDVVPVPTRPLVGAARVQRLTTFVEQLSRQWTRHRSSVDGAMMRGLLSQLVLHAFPELSIHDCRMLTRMPDLTVPNLAQVDRVGEQFVERTAAESLSARSIALFGEPNLRDDSVAGQLVSEQPNRAKFEIPLEDVADGRGFRLIDDQTPLAPVITQRHRAAHPETLLLGSGDLVAAPLAGHLAVELGEGEQHIQREPTHRAGGIELLSHRHERHAVGVEDLDHFREVRERTGQAVDLIDQDYIDKLVANVG